MNVFEKTFLIIPVQLSTIVRMRALADATYSEVDHWFVMVVTNPAHAIALDDAGDNPIVEYVPLYGSTKYGKSSSRRVGWICKHLDGTETTIQGYALRGFSLHFLMPIHSGYIWHMDSLYPRPRPQGRDRHVSRGKTGAKSKKTKSTRTAPGAGVSRPEPSRIPPNGNTPADVLVGPNDPLPSWSGDDDDDPALLLGMLLHDKALAEKKGRLLPFSTWEVDVR